MLHKDLAALTRGHEDHGNFSDVPDRPRWTFTDDELTAFALAVDHAAVERCAAWRGELGENYPSKPAWAGGTDA